MEQIIIVGQLILIVIGGLLSLGIAIASFAFVPSRLWEQRISFCWLLLLVLFFGLVCILFTQVYPLDSTITLRKAIFSLPTGFFLFCLVWSINSVDYKNINTELFVALLSMLFKALGGAIFGYGVLSFILIALGSE